MNGAIRTRRSRLRRADTRREGAGKARLGVALAVLVALLGLLAAGGAGAAYAVYQHFAGGLIPPNEVIEITSWQSSSFYDRNGRFLYQAMNPVSGLYDPVPLEEISPYLIAATIATEDASFYENPGVNFRGLARAFLENFTPLGPGFLEGSGGSSITQQLVRNLYGRIEEGWFERTVERKLKEVVLALEMRRQYSSDQVLEWYLNQVFYGNNAYGVEAAAKRYFGKSAKDLTLAEAAMLAGIPKAPALYDPTRPENKERAEARRQEVLDLLQRHLEAVNRIPPLQERGIVITPQQIEEARSQQVSYASVVDAIEAPHFVVYAQEQVVKMCKQGLFRPPRGVTCDEVISKGGLRITTTLDLELQRLGEQTVNEILDNIGSRYNAHNGAIVAIRPQSGEILAMVGSRNYFDTSPLVQGNVNMATSCRSHGSTMKVFTYITAFERGWVPSTIVEDEPLQLPGPGGRPQPIRNWNGDVYLGKITVRKALSESVNTPAVRTLMAMGEGNVVRTAARMGLTYTNPVGSASCNVPLTERSCGPTWTLGTCEVRLLDMTYAYSALAANGVLAGMPTVEDLPSGFRQVDPAPVLKIEDAQGNVLYQYQPQLVQVVRPAFAYMITDILSKEGITWSRLTIGRPAAAKTGTENDFRDNVVLGYTPELAVGVWMGNTDGTPMAQGAFSASGAGPMWRQFMTVALQHLQFPPTPFRAPQDVVLAECDGRQEVFARGVPVTRPGACRSPTGGVEPERTPTPTPIPSPTLTPTLTPTPRPSPTPTVRPTVTPTPDQDDSEGQGDGRGRGNRR